MRRKRIPAAAACDDGLIALLAAGPWAVGLELRDVSSREEHARLRAAWQVHETAVRAEAARRGLEEPWFASRDYFMRRVDGDQTP